MSGKLIVFEGTDGSGKATQAGELCKRLKREGVLLREIDFPRYGNPFAKPAELYLSGELGKKPEDVNAYAASTLYAVDRFASYKQDWGKFYEDGGLVIADRYTTSNAVHQTSKLPEEQREEYLNWLFDLEYYRLGLPEPNLVFYLDMPVEVSEQMMRKREADTGSHVDIHEQNESYLKSCRESAEKIIQQYGWTMIHCVKNGKLRTVKEIHEEIYHKVKEIL